MNLKLTSQINTINATIQVTGSKSESNRLLLLQALYPNIQLQNVSNSDDSEVMKQALNSEEKIIDIHHAGTTMRFLTSYFAIQEGKEIVLTGSQRMKERPIKILVEALRQLGATITYEENEGYPPIRIIGKRIEKSEVALKANVSSQYISSLLLIAPKLKNGLTLRLVGEITSRPYLEMTLALLSDLGIKNTFEGNIIKVFPIENVNDKVITVESDWSSASYMYSIAALSDISEMKLSSYKKNSLQGDSILAEIYEYFGVKTEFKQNEIRLIKTGVRKGTVPLKLNLIHAPDIAQTIVISCFGIGMGCHITGLHTLKIKETDRLEALKIEITKLGGQIEVTDESLILHPSKKINENIEIATYNDHRMAMAFAPLSLKVPIRIKDAEVVSKSYPDFWKDLKKVGINSVEYTI